MQLDFTSVQVGTVELRTEILGVPVPPYQAPELTGDELLDEMLELIAYRDYQRRATPEARRMEAIADIRAMTGIDITEKLTNVIDEELAKHAKIIFDLK